MLDDSLPDWAETCEAAARAGGRELLAWQGRFNFRAKGVADLVTDADLASQAAIQRVITDRFPGHSFIGEESDLARIDDRGDVLTWVVDPLDGTTNYVHGYPQYAVSVALSRRGELLVGTIYDPLRDDCYSAAVGKGAWLDGQRLQVSGATQAADALVAVSLPPRVRPEAPDLKDFIAAVQACRAVRRSGSAALNLAHVARGWLDAFWATQIHPWDVAAGVLLIREAGGLVAARDGARFDLWDPHFIASASQPLQTELLAVLTPFGR